MKIIADNKIPYLVDFFSPHHDMLLLPGESISRHDLINADILLTRTVTPVNADLLHNTAIKFVGTATTGTDHIDLNWLAQHAIFLATAAGANAQAVAEYVSHCLSAIKKQGLFIDKKTAGIIGCGRIGQLVANLLISQGLEVICYDPLLTEQVNFNFVSLEELITRADCITLHVPLTKTGLFPTYHMINNNILKKIKPGAILINTSRGNVIDETALLQAKNITLCLDVWEHEPHISIALLNKVFIGTPHIAGYSHDAKYRATQMMYDAAAHFFHWNAVRKKKQVYFKTNNNYCPFIHTQQLRRAFLHCKTRNEIATVFIAERKILR